MTVSQITTNELLIYLREDIADASAAELVSLMRSAAVSCFPFVWQVRSAAGISN